MRCEKVLFYSLEELYKEFCEVSNTLPYTNLNLKEISDLIFSAPAPSYPINLGGDNIVSLWKEVYARFYKEPIFKLTLKPYIDIPSFSEAGFKEFVLKEFQQWFLRVVSIISRTYPYYNTLLGAYGDAQTHLMDDITASSINTIKYNETPQNDNSSGTYEGDNHLTNFTKTEGENSSPLTSKIMRLKEIQDHYKNTLDDWVNEFHCLFYEEGDIE